MSDDGIVEIGRYPMVGGPFNGVRSHAAPSEVGALASFPKRTEIEGRWYVVSHLYVLEESGELCYVFSQYEHDVNGA